LGFRIHISLATLLLLSCTPGKHPLREGPWTVELDLSTATLPFNLDFRQDSLGRDFVVVQNGEEEIIASDVMVTHDSLRIRMPLFDSEFLGMHTSDSVISGVWFNYLKGDDYRVPFIARSGGRSRFPRQSADAALRFSGSWRVVFSPGTTGAYNSIGEFHAETDGSITGTFMTETGDYRYLAGAAHGDSLQLSCFDGSHAFLFAARAQGDTLFGNFWSGIHWQEPWVAVRNDSYRLRDPDSLSFLREGYDRVEFRFPDTDGIERSPSDTGFIGRPLLVHIMGSWCPNCMDETVLLREMHDKYANDGLRIMAIAFEKHSDPSRAMAGLRRFKSALRVPYPILYAGSASKEEATSKLPFLQRLISYPTCIFIDRQGRVLRIRTGFYGPGTGHHYAEYKRGLDEYINHLVNAK